MSQRTWVFTKFKIQQVLSQGTYSSAIKWPGKTYQCAFPVTHDYSPKPSWILKVFTANYLHPFLSDFLEKIHTNILISGYLPGTFSFMKCHHIYQSQGYIGTSNHPNSRGLYSKVKYNSFDCLTQVEKRPCPTASGGFTFEAHTAIQHCMLQKTKYHLMHKFIWRKGEKKTSINMTQH